MRASTTFYIFIYLFVTVSCGSINSKHGDTAKLNLITSEKLKGKIELLYNSDHTSVICIGGKSKLSQTYSFFVYSLKNNKSITKTYNNVSDVLWYRNKAIKYKYLSGIVKAGENNTKYTIINIKD